MKMTKEEAFNMLQGKKVYVGKFTKEVQEKLFELGFEWASTGKKIMKYDYIITSPHGLQTCIDYKNFIEYFDNKEEITISQILGIELEPEFNDGDIVTVSDNNDFYDAIVIIKDINLKITNGIKIYTGITEKKRMLEEKISSKWGEIRHATDQEKQTLFNELDKQGYKWNSEEKKLEKKLWRAEYNGFYYIISDDLSVNLIQKENDYVDNIYYDIKNYFKTKEEAQQYADKIKELLKNR